ncbi:UDP-glucose 6-dehydrogenase [Moraxella sp. FZLJ2107]|uniref:UDP-glucose 6-dehydrogenase n=1 Tax=unclassified Moraxella TaxID=2685852 RepID=UPI0020C90418|nr:MULTISPECIES: UDP-glucose 6-dehydrogenase [unclassified Moraxella]UTO04336.1 UDP-glucose 6-dehydrogenase [Moraxella sp. FZLJ2107]UTO23169.1 UDP-glucose 6-dehydrogenase [Moraxella sp. FZLJ2109]
MTDSILLIGCTNESINTAIWLASLNKSVQLLADESAVSHTLASYKFDHQMSALWQMYTQTGQIAVVASPATAAYVWLFLDAQGVDEHLPSLFDTTAQVILSGSVAIGDVATLANEFATSQVCYVPFVFMKDGTGFGSLSSPDMVMIGEKTLGTHTTNELLLILLSRTDKQFVGDIKTVEFARAGIMAMLATRLSFVNEMARLADASGVDMTTVQTVMGLDKRIGKDYLSAGWGFGGQALPTEVELLDQFFKQNHVQSRLLSTVSQINEDQKELIFRKFWRYFEGFIDGKSVMIWGAGYRANTGRTTNGAIHPLLKLLWSYGIKTSIYAPNAGFELTELYGDEPLFGLCDDAYDLAGRDALFVLNWSEAVLPTIGQLNQFGLPIFDAKNILNNQLVAQYAGDYHGIGRNHTKGEV